MSNVKTLLLQMAKSERFPTFRGLDGELFISYAVSHAKGGDSNKNNRR